jgi:hypothetical protein
LNCFYLAVRRAAENVDAVPANRDEILQRQTGMTSSLYAGTDIRNKTGLSNLGTVVSVRGSVVDMRLDAHLAKGPSRDNPETDPRLEIFDLGRRRHR